MFSNLLFILLSLFAIQAYSSQSCLELLIDEEVIEIDLTDAGDISSIAQLVRVHEPEHIPTHTLGDVEVKGVFGFEAKGLYIDIDDHVEGAGLVYFSYLKDYKELFSESGVDKASISQISDLILNVLDGELELPILSDSLRTLDDEGLFHELQIGFLNEGVVFEKELDKYKTLASYTRTNPSEIIYDKYSFIKWRKKSRWYHKRVDSMVTSAVFEEEENKQNGVVMLQYEYTKADRSSGFTTFEGSFFHELVHSADEEFMTEWLHANVTLLLEGFEPDALFKKYVFYSDKYDNFFITQEFETLFTELRAYYVSALVAWFVEEVKDQEKKSQLKSKIVHTALLSAFRYLEHKDFDYVSVGIFLEELNLEDDFDVSNMSSDKHLEMGKKLLELTIGKKSWGEQMKRTIEKANSF